MYFIKRGVGSEAALRSGTFTGVVYGDRAFAEENIAITNVLFTPSARTYWHSHSGGQLLTVDRVAGSSPTAAAKRASLRAPTLCSPRPAKNIGTGRRRVRFLLHTSVAMGTTTWLEEVSDADYQLGLDQGHPPNGLNPPRTTSLARRGAGYVAEATADRAESSDNGLPNERSDRQRTTRTESRR